MLPIPAQHQGTAFEFTVVRPLNQGSPRQLDVIIGGRPFFVFFWASKKIQKPAASVMHFKVKAIHFILFNLSKNHNSYQLKITDHEKR